ncbi:MAG: hypothetical protein WCD43_19360 [Candidatus Acidiferrales bacterium]
MRRHWITTLLAYLCFITAAALLYSLCLLPLKTGAAGNAPLYTAMWRILGLFPSPTSVSWVVSFVARSIAPALVRSKIYSGVINALTLVFSVILGLAILQMRTWARWALVAICGLTAALQAFTLFQLAANSPGFLRVLDSNYRGASAGYVSGVGPGAILASLAISITLLRLLLRDGLPAIAPADSEAAAVPSSSAHPAQRDARSQKAYKFFLVATAAALMMEVALLLSGFGSGEPNSGTTRLLLCVLIAPHAVILARSWRGPDRFSLGLAAGYGLIIAYMGAIFLPAFVIGLAWVVNSPRTGGIWTFLLLEGVPMAQFCVFVSAITIARSLSPKRPKSAMLGIWGLAFLIPVILGTAGPQFYFDWQQGRMRVPGVKSGGDELQDLKNQQRAAWDLVRAYGKCAFLYSKSHPESGFPENAAEMGPGGTACLTKTEAAGAPAGYSFRYAAGKSEGAARYDRFSAATQLNMQHHYDAALMDERGIYVLGQSAVEQKSMVSADQVSWDSAGMYKHPWNVTSWMLPRIQVCSNLLRKESASSEYPSTLAAILSVKEKPNDPDCLKLFGSRPDLLLQAAANSNRVEDHGYILDYEPSRDASGKIVHFGVSLRPKTFGEDGVRSYFMDESGVIHATSEDRPATSADPEAMTCESVLGEVCQDAPAKQ